MSRPVPFLRAALLVGGLLVLLPAPTRADAVSDFYSGKTITMIVGYTPSGTYDIWARLVARHLPKHIPGNPTMIVQNMPGAGSLTASNHIYHVAVQDGTVMGLMSATNPFQPLLGIEQAKFDAQKYTWLGSPTVDTAVILVWANAPVSSFEDAKKTEVVLGSTSPNGTSSYYARIFNDIFKTKFKLVYGYPGMVETFMAMERGEVQGHSSPFWSFMKSAKADWIRDKKVKVLLQYGGRRNPDLPDVPFGADLPMSDDDRQLFDAAMAPLSLGYPFLAGPGVPADRAKALRAAYAATFKDPEFLAEAAKQNLDIAPITGEQIEAIIKKAYAVPQKVIDRMKTLYEGEAPK